MPRKTKKPAETASSAPKLDPGAVLASIDLAMESAVTAGVVDRESQLASWTPESVSAEAQLE